MRRIVSSGVLLALFACGPTPPSRPVAQRPIPVAPVPDSPPLNGDELCSLLFEAPRRHLDGACSVQEEQTDTFTQLDQLVQKRVADCRAILSPAVKQGRVRVSNTEACAAQIAQAGWRASLRDADIARFAACSQLITGLQREGHPCAASLECAAGLTCESDNTCQPRTAQQCDTPSSWLFGEARAQCGEAAYCDGTFFDQPPHHAGYSPTGDPWRGDAPALGVLGSSAIGSVGILGQLHTKPGSKPPKVKVNPVTVGPRLPPELIQRIVRRNFSRLRACYNEGLKGNPNLAGKITVRFVIAIDGTVNTVSADSSLPDQVVVSCVTRAFYSMQFPEPEGGLITVSYPIIFTPGDDAEQDSPSTSETGEPNTQPEPEPQPPPQRLVCLQRRTSGAGCAHDTQCTSGICRAGHCAETLGRFEDVCDGDGQCEPNLRCTPTGICMPLLEAGQRCQRTADCQGACIQGKCAPLCGEG